MGELHFLTLDVPSDEQWDKVETRQVDWIRFKRDVSGRAGRKWRIGT